MRKLRLREGKRFICDQKPTFGSHPSACKTQAFNLFTRKFFWLNKAHGDKRKNAPLPKLL
jgi:hypothetical protein